MASNKQELPRREGPTNRLSGAQHWSLGPLSSYRTVSAPKRL